MEKQKILAISGSLRSNATNTAILKYLKIVTEEVDIEIYGGLADLPHFSPLVNEEETPDSVVDFYDKIKEADAVIICTPEYAFGVPGTLKNALDWTVSTGIFYQKPVALITAASSGEKAHQAMLWILEAISAKVIPEMTLLISNVRTKVNSDGQVTDLATQEALKKMLDSLKTISV